MGEAFVQAGVVRAVEGDGVSALPAADEVLTEAGRGRAARLCQGQGLPGDAELREPEAQPREAAQSDRLLPEQSAIARDRGCKVLHRHGDAGDPGHLDLHQ